jgi:hypothetical protein
VPDIADARLLLDLLRQAIAALLDTTGTQPVRTPPLVAYTHHRGPGSRTARDGGGGGVGSAQAARQTWYTILFNALPLVASRADGAAPRGSGTATPVRGRPAAAPVGAADALQEQYHLDRNCLALVHQHGEQARCCPVGQKTAILLSLWQ